jgi:hypothetical protein
VTQHVASPAEFDQAKFEREVTSRVEAIVAASEVRQKAEIQKVAEQQKKLQFDYKADMLTAAENYRLLRRSVDPYMMTQRASLDRSGQ